jgi:hypothetical protein
MHFYQEKGDLDKAVAIAKDACPYMHPRLNSVAVGGQPGNPVETKEVAHSSLRSCVKRRRAIPAIGHLLPRRLVENKGDSASQFHV